ncbi:TOTE conflict system archaeo-eukaryotic primase domain-containing protein [Mesorhizobium helmanticense]|uniref:TOTE conflict system archaeo-eukaryotic primase domain-containing protein n=1 Tax=Mesorhizobium helmanticense TaxID=1776423 RepID=UPI00142D3D57|nr:hypothetical protein [Mesorhizobium helmanticense]
MDRQWFRLAVSKCDFERDDEIERIRGRLKSLAAEQRALEARLVELNQPQALLPLADVSRSFAKAAPVTNASTAAEKIALCRRLFAGRSDVHPVRWENRKAGRSGYAPACANEWVKGICGKPQVKCREMSQPSLHSRLRRSN